MEKPSNAIRYLEMIEKQHEGKVAHSDLANYLDMKARKAGVPLTVTYELTPLCNFDCRMCYVHMMKDQLGSASVLTTDQWKDLMSQACDAGMLAANLTGGECLSHPGFEELYLFLQDRGCDVQVLTNGSLLDDRRIEFLRVHRPVSVQITLYGCDEDSYERVTGRRAFGKVTENIRKLRDAGLRVAVTVTPNRYLGEDALETLRIAYSLGNTVRINPCLTKPREETGRSGAGDEADLDLYARLYRLQAELDGTPPAEPFEGELPEAGSPCGECAVTGMLCGGGMASCTVNWKGIMTFCNTLDAVQCKPLEDGLLNAWKKLNQAARNWPNAPECIGCAYKSVCVTCAAYEYQFAEPGKQPLALCERTKYFVRRGVWSVPVCE